MKYRAEIDGLRTIAIIPVLLYHAGVPYITGGFVGVDIFFVISGFLITRIIVDELNAGTFSVLDFYRRRVLRIVPVLVAVVLAVLIAGHFVLFPGELRSLTNSAVSAALFSSNIYFWLSTNYFDTVSDELPLLHTWSLAVEEQFYIFLPLVLIGIHRWLKGKYIPFIVAAVAVSFALSAWGVVNAGTATFYLLPTRAWELGVGGLAALGGPWRPRTRALGEVVCWLAVALAVSPMFVLTDRSLFPGWNALMPVAGAALLITTLGENSVRRFLSWSPIVYIGQISYALYLWHWPVIAFDKFLTGPDMGAIAIVRVILVSFLLAAVSRPLIEMPFRRGFGIRHAKPIVVSGVLCLAMVAVVSVAVGRLGSLQRNFPAEVLRIAKVAEYEDTDTYRYQFRSGTCFIEDRNPPGSVFDRQLCLKMSTTKPNILLMGDSHAAHLWRSLQLVYPDYNFLQATFPGCRPVIGARGLRPCVGFVNSILKDFVKANKLDGILLAGRWWYDEIPNVEDTVYELTAAGNRVAVIGPTVEYDGRAPYILAREKLLGSTSMLSAARSEDRYQFARHMQTELKGAGISFISLLDVECPSDKCVEYATTDFPAQFDGSHLTLTAAVRFTNGLLDRWLPGLPTKDQH